MNILCQMYQVLFFFFFFFPFICFLPLITGKPANSFVEMGYGFFCNPIISLYLSNMKVLFIN